MSFSVSRCWGVALLLAALALGGCLPSPQSQSDEEKELHFLEGRSRVNTLDYTGAIESFEKALEANPQSGSAHFELGWLFDRKEPDPAAAIYHYEKYLALRPGAENAKEVKERIVACKQDLARGVDLAPVTQKQQQDFDKLVEENRQLTEQNKQLNEELAKWRAYGGGRSSPPTNAPLRASSSPRTFAAGGPGETAEISSSAIPSTERSNSGSSTARTYVVQKGDTPSMIARKCGIKLEALLAANPHLDPRRMRPGQTLSLP